MKGFKRQGKPTPPPLRFPGSTLPYLPLPMLISDGERISMLIPMANGCIIGFWRFEKDRMEKSVVCTECGESFRVEGPDDGSKWVEQGVTCPLVPIAKNPMKCSGP